MGIHSYKIEYDFNTLKVQCKSFELQYINYIGLVNTIVYLRLKDMALPPVNINTRG